MEINIPPKEWQDRLTFLGGINKYDLPNFKLAWAQYETYTAGGIWSVDEKYFRGYRQLLSGSGEFCWSLFQWHASEEFGSPEAFYVQNLDEDSGLQILGEYPYSGIYTCLYNLRYHEQVDGKMVFKTMPLNTTTFDRIIPIILAAKEVSLEKRRAAITAAREMEEEEKLKDIERHLRDKATPFTGSVSFTRQGVRSTAVDQKMLALQRQWSQLQESARKFKSGIQTK